MADTIKGLTVSIGADIKEFQKGIKRMDKDINETNRQVDALQKSLVIEYDATRFSQAQKLAQDAIKKTEVKAQSLRDELKYLDDVGTDKSSEKYKRLETQLIQTEAKAVSLKNKLEKINEIKVNNIIRQFDQVGNGLNTLGNALKPLSIGVTALLGSLSAVGLSTVKYADDVGTLATQIGLSAEAMQKWQYIAMQTDVTDQQLQTGLMKVQGAFGKLASGTIDKSSQALLNLGITVEDATKGMDANFDNLVKRISSIEDPILQANYANEIFGEKLGAKILPLIKSGGEGLNQLAKEFENLGYLTNEQVEKFGEFDNVMNTIRYQFRAIKNEIGVALLPVMQELSDIISTKIIPSMKKVSTWFSTLSKEQLNMIIKVTALVSALAPIVLILGKLSLGVGGLVNSIKALQGALNVLMAHPIVAIIASVIGLLIILYNKNEEFRKSINNLVRTLTSTLQPILQVIIKTIKELFASLMPVVELLLNSIAQILIPLINLLQPILRLLDTILQTIIIPVIPLITQIANSSLGFLMPLIQAILPTLVSTLNTIMTVMRPIFDFINTLLIPVFEKLGDIIVKVFGAIPNIINNVLKFIEKMVNSVIDFVNDLIYGLNTIGKVLGYQIDYLQHVSLQIPTVESIQSSTSGGMSSTSPVIKDTSIGDAENSIGQVPATPNVPVINNDYSKKDITINVTVENYAEEVDVDDLVNQINLKLAEQM